MSSAPGGIRPAVESSLRINRKAAAILAGIGLVLGAVALALSLTGGGAAGNAASREVDRLIKAKRDDLALRHINRYLAEHPDDPGMIQRQARLLTRRAETLEQLLGASRWYERLRQVAGNHPDSNSKEIKEIEEAARRELAAVYIKYSDALEANALYRGLSDLTAYERRYNAAKQIALQLVEEHPNDPECHRLLAAAQEGLAVPGAEEELEGALSEYNRALKLEPTHVEASERLARLYRERKRDPEKAVAVLDALLKKLPKSIEVRLARYRYFREAARADRKADKSAGAELEEALKLDEASLPVLLAAAEHALRNGDVLEAREYVRKMQAADDLRVPMMQGLVEFAQEHPQEAIEQWRQGLIQMQGTHAELTWWLAYVQLRLGRVTQATPLIDQYRRLVESDDDSGLRFLMALADERGGRPKKAAVVLEQIRAKAPGRLKEEIEVALGRCYEALGERELAMRTFRQAEQAAPGSALPRLALTSLLLEQDPETAVRELSAAAETNDDPNLLSALAKAHVLRQASRPAGSRSWAELDRLIDLLKDRTAPSSLAMLRADRAALGGRPDDAIRTLEEAVAADPIDPRLWAGLASILANAGRPDDALAALDRGSRPEAADDSATLRLTKARLLVALGRGREAQVALSENIGGLPPDQQAALAEALGRLRATQGDVDGAHAAFIRWAALSPETPQPALALLQMALDRGDRKDADRQLKELLRLAGGEKIGADDLSYRLGQALVLHRFAQAALASSDADQRKKTASELKDAEELADGVIADAPKLAPAYMLKGQILELRKHSDSDAALAYRQAWELGDESALPRLLDVMARLKQFDEIESLVGPSDALKLGAFSVVTLLNAGESQRAAKILEQMVADPARTDAWRARLMELAGRPDAVEAILRDRADRAPADDPAPWMALLGTQARHGRSAAVIDKTIEEFLAKAETDRPDVLRAAALFAASRYAEAERAFQKVDEDRKDDPQALVQVAHYYAQTGRPDRASATLERALAVDPADRSVALQLAVQLTERVGDQAAAVRALQLVGGDQEPADPEGRLARAVVLARSPEPGRRGQALVALEALVADLDARTQMAVLARNYLTRLLLVAGQTDRAVALSAISAASGADATGLALHAEALIAAGRHAEAELELDRLLTLNPMDAAEPALRARLITNRSGADQAPAVLADTVQRRGATLAAEAFGRAAFNQIIGEAATGSASITPPDLDAADQIARSLAGRKPALGWMSAQVQVLRGQFDEAIAACRAAAADPAATDTDRYEACRLALAAADGKGQNPDALNAAAEVVDAALAARADDPALLTMRALAHHGLGQYDQEAELYRKVLALWPVGRPETDQVQNNLAWVLSEGNGRPEEGLALAEALVARRGEIPQFLCTRGVALLRLGRADHAIDDLEKAVRADPANGRRLLHLARAYRDAGRDQPFRDAVEQLRRTGLTPQQCDPTERGELQAILGS